MSKGCVIAGGGASGCFSAGVLYGLFNNEEYSKIYGTSAGALNAALLAQAYVNKSPEIIKEVWTKMIRKDSDIFKRKYISFVFGKAPLSFEPLVSLVNKVADFNSICKLDKEIILTSVDILTGSICYFSNKDTLPNDLKKALLASASVPFFTDPVKLGNKLLVDGGVKENAPVSKMLKNKDIDSLLIILASPDQLHKVDFSNKLHLFTDSFGILNRVMSIMMNEITTNDFKNVEHINELLESLTKDQIGTNEWLKNKRKVGFEIIIPETIPVEELLKFDPKKLKEGFDMGIKAAEKYLQSKSIKN